jgi:glycopeptide antibiotics resistance protein
MDAAINVLTSVLYALYQYFGASLVLSVFVLFFVMYCEEHGVKKSIKALINRVKTDSKFRIKWILIFYIAMMLYKTLLCRQLYTNPLARVKGIWGLYDQEGKLYTENIENILLFIPFILILFLGYYDCLFKKATLISCLWKGFCISFCMTLTIEFTQLFLKLGTFQLSDIFFNTVGGVIGAALYWIFAGRKHGQTKNNTNTENG